MAASGQSKSLRKGLRESCLLPFPSMAPPGKVCLKSIASAITIEIETDFGGYIAENLSQLLQLAAAGASLTAGRDVEPPATAIACCSGLRMSMMSPKLGLSAGSDQVRLIRLAIVGCIDSGSSRRIFPQPTAPTTCAHALLFISLH